MCLNDMSLSISSISDEWIFMFTVHLSMFGSLLLKACSMATYDASSTHLLVFLKWDEYTIASSMNVGDSYYVCVYDL